MAEAGPSNELFSGRRTLCVVTGGSRGFGRACAIALAKALTSANPDSGLILLARDGSGLSETRAAVLEANANLRVVLSEVDLAEIEDEALMEILKHLCQENFPSKEEVNKPFEVLLVVHNAGSLGDITKTALEHANSLHLARYFYLNVVSPIMLGAALHRLTCSDVIASDPRMISVTVNVSSLAAIRSFPTWSLYCSAKAARDMFFECMAKEAGEDNPLVRVVNYAPGPLDTAMQEEVRASCGNPELRQTFLSMKEAGQLVDPMDSAHKMVSILTKNSWTSGTHIDYMDS